MAWGYYGYQLSKGPRKFGDQILTFTRCCCHLQLATFPVAIYRNLTSLAVKLAELQSTTLLPMETRKVVRGNTVILSPKHKISSVAPYSTDNSSSLATRRIIFGTWHYTMWNICGI